MHSDGSGDFVPRLLFMFVQMCLCGTGFPYTVSAPVSGNFEKLQCAESADQCLFFVTLQPTVIDRFTQNYVRFPIYRRHTLVEKEHNLLAKQVLQRKSIQFCFYQEMARGIRL